MEGAAEGLAPSATAPGAPTGGTRGRSGLRRAIGPALDVARAVRRPVESWLVSSSTVGTGPFLDPTRFDWIPELEAGHAVVRAELEALLTDDRALQTSHDMYAAASIRADRWQTVLLRYYGMECGVAQRCPRTMALLDSVPGVRAASFSILWPGATIPPHRGPYAGVVRYHLAVVVPEPAAGCGIRVGDEVERWEQGRSLVFDESFEHEAWNRTDGMRAVLFLDVERPLRQPARSVNTGVLAAFTASPYARATKRRTAAWEAAQGLSVPS